MNPYQSPAIPGPAEYSVVVLAHQAVYPFASIIADRWRYLGPTTISVPNAEENVRTGPPIFRRFLTVMERALASEWKTLVIAEYDTLPLGETRWTCPEVSMLSTWWVLGDTGEYAALSPWIFGRRAACLFVEAGLRWLDAPMFEGLLDRWIGFVAKRAGISMAADWRFHGHPPDAVFAAAESGARMIHPVKDMSTVMNLDAIYQRRSA